MAFSDFGRFGRRRASEGFVPDSGEFAFRAKRSGAFLVPGLRALRRLVLGSTGLAFLGGVGDLPPAATRGTEGVAASGLSALREAGLGEIGLREFSLIAQAQAQSLNIPAGESRTVAAGETLTGGEVIIGAGGTLIHRGTLSLGAEGLGVAGGIDTDATVIVEGGSLYAPSAAPGIDIGGYGSVALDSGAEINTGGANAIRLAGNGGIVIVSGDSTVSSFNTAISSGSGGDVVILRGASVSGGNEAVDLGAGADRLDVYLGEGPLTVSGGVDGGSGTDVLGIGSRVDATYSGGGSGLGETNFEREGFFAEGADTTLTLDTGTVLTESATIVMPSVGDAGLVINRDDVSVDGESAFTIMTGGRLGNAGSLYVANAPGVRFEAGGGALLNDGGTIVAVDSVAVLGGSGSDVVGLAGGSLYGASGAAISLGGGDDRLDVYLDEGPLTVEGSVAGGAGMDVLAIGARTDATYGGGGSGLNEAGFEGQGFFAEGADTTLTLARGALSGNSTIFAPSSGVAGLVVNYNDVSPSVTGDSPFTIEAGARLDNFGDVYSSVRLVHGVRVGKGGTFTHRGTITMKTSFADGIFSEGGVIRIVGGAIGAYRVGIRGGSDSDVIGLAGGSIYGGSGAMRLDDGDDRLDIYLGEGPLTVNGAVDGGSGTDVLGIGSRVDATYSGGGVSFSHQGFERQGFFAEGAETTLTLNTGSVVTESATIITPASGDVGLVVNRDHVAVAANSAFTITPGTRLDNSGSLEITNAPGIRVQGGTFTHRGVLVASGGEVSVVGISISESGAVHVVDGTIDADDVAINGGGGDEVVSLNGGSLRGESGTAADLGGGADRLDVYIDASGAAKTMFSGTVDGGVGSDVLAVGSDSDATYSGGALGFTHQGFERDGFFAEGAETTLTLARGASTESATIFTPTRGAVGLVLNRDDVSVDGPVESAFTIMAGGRLENSGSLYASGSGGIGVLGSGAMTFGLAGGTIVSAQGVAVKGSSQSDVVSLDGGSLHGASGTAVSLGGGDDRLDVYLDSSGPLAIGGTVRGGDGSDIVGIGARSDATYSGEDMGFVHQNFERRGLFAEGADVTLTIDTPSSLTTPLTILTPVIGAAGLVSNRDDASIVDAGAFTVASGAIFENSASLHVENAHGVVVESGGAFTHRGTISATGADADGVLSEGGTLNVVGGTIDAQRYAVRGGSGSDVVGLTGGSLYGASGAVSLGAGDDRLDVFLGEGPLAVDGTVDGGDGIDVLAVGARADATYGGGDSGFQDVNFERRGFFAKEAETTLTLETGSVVTESATIIAPSSGAAGLVLNRDDVSVVGESAFTIEAGLSFDNSGSLHVENAHGVTIENGSSLVHRGTIRATGSSSEGVSGDDNATVRLIGGVIVADDRGIQVSDGGFVSLRQGASIYAADDGLLMIDEATVALSDSTLEAVGDGVFILESGSIDLSAGASLHAGGDGVHIAGDRGVVTLSGATLESGDDGLYFDASGTVTMVGGMIVADDQGIQMFDGGFASLQQGASIYAAGDAFRMNDEATLALSGSTLEAVEDGVYMGESGSIGLSDGASLHAGGDGLRIAGDSGIITLSGATLRADGDGLYFDAFGTVVASDSMFESGGDGLYSREGGSVALRGGSVRAVADAVRMDGSGSIVMSGSTLEAGSDGVYLFDGGTIALDGGASIFAADHAVKLDGSGSVDIVDATLTGGSSAIEGSSAGDVISLSGGTLTAASGTISDMGGGDDLFMADSQSVVRGTVDGGSGTMDRYVDAVQTKTILSGAAPGATSIDAHDAYSRASPLLSGEATIVNFESVEARRFASDFSRTIVQRADLDLVARSFPHIDLNGAFYLMDGTAGADPTFGVESVFLNRGVLSGAGTLAFAGGDLLVEGPGTLAPGMSVGEMRFAPASGSGEVVLRNHIYEAEIDINPLGTVAQTAESDIIVVENGALEFDDYRIRLMFIDDPDPNGGVDQTIADLASLALDTPYTATIASASGGISGDFSLLEPSYNDDDLATSLTTTVSVIGDRLVVTFARVLIQDAALSAESYATSSAAFMRLHAQSLKESLARNRVAYASSAEIGLNVWNDSHYARHERDGEHRLGAHGYETDIYNSLAGVDVSAIRGMDLTAGAFIGYLGGDFSSQDGLEANHDYESGAIGAYLHYALGDARFFTQIGYGFGRVDADRVYRGEKAEADYDLNVLSVGAGAEFSSFRSDGLSVTPKIGLDYMSFRRSRVDESGSDLARPFALTSDRYEEFHVSGGIDFEYDLSSRNGYGIDLRILGDLQGSGVMSASALKAEKQDGSGFDRGVKPYGDVAMDYSLGLEANFTDRLRGHLSYEGRTDFGDYLSHGVRVGLNYAF